MAKMKKAQSGIEGALEAKTAARKTKGPALREGQMSRLDRIAGSNPDRAIKVGKRMLKRAAPKAQNGIAKMAKKDPKEAMKKGKKAEKGGNFGMLSVKAGVDNNPNPTQADRIAGATKKAMSGMEMMKNGGGKKKKMMRNGGGILSAPKKDGLSIQLGYYQNTIGKNTKGKNTKAVGLTKAKYGKSMMKSGGRCKNGC